MKVTDLQFDPKSMIKGPADRSGQVRSAGLHLSQIYGDLTKYQREKDLRRGEMSEKELEYYRVGGFLWEDVVGLAMAESMRTFEIVRPGEFTKDGIIGSPDNVRLNPWRILETKATWKSVRKWDEHPLEKYFWVWLVQMKGYCKMVGTMEAEVYGFFVNGDYKGGGPQTRGRLIEFSEIEIEENWNMLVGHARRKGWL